MNMEEIEKLLNDPAARELLKSALTKNRCEVVEVVELTFEKKPTAEIKDVLKEAGFNWNYITRKWWAYKTEATMEVGKEAIK